MGYYGAGDGARNKVLLSHMALGCLTGFLIKQLT